MENIMNGFYMNTGILTELDDLIMTINDRHFHQCIANINNKIHITGDQKAGAKVVILSSERGEKGYLLTI